MPRPAGRVQGALSASFGDGGARGASGPRQRRRLLGARRLVLCLLVAIAMSMVAAASAAAAGTVVAWGENTDGALGNGNETNSDVPVAVSGLGEVTAISAGERFSLALLSNGTVTAWGGGPYGQLGNGSEANSDV